MADSNVLERKGPSNNGTSELMECRSALFMPASNQRVLLKGVSLPADAIIIDLEDSVAPDSKALAREQARQALREQDYGYRIKALRLNAADSPWYEEDISAAAIGCPDAIVLPKADTVQDVLALSAAMDRYPMLANTRIWAMIESPMAVLNARDIAAAGAQCPRLAALLIGNNDMAKESNMPVSSDRTHLLPWIMHLVAVAHAYKLTLLDGVFNDFADATGFRQECQQGVAMGMHGKLLIHPSQVSVANEVFAPSAEELARAQLIVSAFALPEHADAGVVQIEGQMVERLHLDMALTLLARDRQLAQRQGG